MITSLQDLRDLFARHCTCRPLDLTRGPDDHGHACDVGILSDIQTVLRGDHSTEQLELDLYEAVKRCDKADHSSVDPT